MDSSDNAYSALDAIDSVAFKVGLKGYNVDEVDEFLERLSAEVHQMKELVHQQRQQLRQAAERINQLDSRDGATPAQAPQATPAPAPRMVTVSGAEQVTAMIAMAQQFIEQAQGEAEAKAREMTTSAQERAREIVAEARSRAEDEVNRLNGLKQRLSEDVETLSRHSRPNASDWAARWPSSHAGWRARCRSAGPAPRVRRTPPHPRRPRPQYRPNRCRLDRPKCRLRLPHPSSSRLARSSTLNSPRATIVSKSRANW
jgi:DivIVA domain-containing protein